MLFIAIMCESSGTRLWPLSREHMPEQFLNLTDNDFTMFQLSCIRALKIKHEKLLVVCNKDHVDLAKKQLAELYIDNYCIIAEPFGKNTCASISLVCNGLEPDDDILIMSSDYIWNDDVFINCVDEGLKYVENHITVFGIEPTCPDTGYGYLMCENNKLLRFIENPDVEHAVEYVNMGYKWNSGIFLFKNKVMTEELKKNANDIYDCVCETMNNSAITGDVLYLNQDYFKNVVNKSIDYVVMEHYTNGIVILYDSYWADIWSFKSLHNHFEKDDNDNYLRGDIIVQNTTN